MEYYGTSFWVPTDSICHFGIKGQKWGERHWQNSDGSFNEAGKKRYFGNGGGENYHKIKKSLSNTQSVLTSAQKKIKKVDETAQKIERQKRKVDNQIKEVKNFINDPVSSIKNKISPETIEKAQKIAKTVAITAAVAGGTYLAIKGGKYIKNYMEANPNFGDSFRNIMGSTKEKMRSINGSDGDRRSAIKAHNMMKDLAEYKNSSTSLYNEHRQDIAKMLGLDPKSNEALSLVDKISTFSSNTKNNRSDLSTAYDELIRLGGNKVYAKRLLTEAATGRTWDIQARKDTIKDSRRLLKEQIRKHI